MKSFSPGACMPLCLLMLNSTPCTPPVPSPISPSPQAGGNPKSALPQVATDNWKLRARRQPPGQPIFALSNLFNSVSCRQECSFRASFKPPSALGMGPGSGAAPSTWPGGWPTARELSSACTGYLSVQPPALQSSPGNSGMRNIHPCHFSKPPQAFQTSSCPC